MMRVALLLSGQVRGNDASASLHQHIIKKYDVDVYCQYWHQGDDRQHHRELTALYAPEAIRSDAAVFNTSDYCAKHHAALHQNHVVRSRKGTYGYPYHHLFSQLLGLQHVSNMFNWADYDFIIRARYDKINIINFPDLHQLSTQHFYAGNRHPAYDGVADYFMDLIFIMPNMMQSYCHAFDLMHQADVSNRMYTWSKSYADYFFPEYVFAYLLEELNFKERYIKLPYDKFLIEPA